jgi:pimeloyl-ACP methyl ester carboxylesterase
MPSPPEGARFLDVTGHSLHYACLGSEYEGSPIVFLHEGLGSVELWRRFPSDVVTRTRRPAVVYARRGNGWSTPLREPRRRDFMHVEALEVLPRVLRHLVAGTPTLVGHSDGASIAIVHAGAGNPVERLVLIAPHVFVEDVAIASIASIRESFGTSELAEKMAKYHTEPETTFKGWADIWLSPEFRDWNIEDHLPGIKCPTLLIQGDADEYGTTSQLDAIEEKVNAPIERLLVEGADHSPHLSHPEIVAAAVADFVDWSSDG